MRAKKILSILILALAAAQIFSWPWSRKKKKNSPENKIERPKELETFERAYPDLLFTCGYDSEKQDFKITVHFPGKAVEFYWSAGSLIPEEELENKEMYWPIIYPYPAELRDPDSMTDEEKERLREFSSSSNRKNGSGAPMFFFEELYDSRTRASLEAQLVRIQFLGKPTTIHRRIRNPLNKVEERILDAAKSDNEVAEFIDEIKSAAAYNWRIISGTNRKSFHSLGIAIDILPKSQKGKEIFWSWAKDRNPNGWMLTPLSRRWMPPKAVIEIFEQEGFIWGGKWGIWDNMHFEYHPELLAQIATDG